MGFYATNGTSIKALSIDSVLGAGFESGLAADASPRVYFAVVPFVRRAVEVRCNAVASVPITLQRGERDVSADKAYTALMASLKDLLWRTEFALCLSPYGAYWRKQTNRYGTNPTPEWLLPSACWPFITAEVGLSSIRYIHPWGVPKAGTVEYLPPEEVVRFWYPSLSRANWPGEPPGITALSAAGALNNSDTFVSDFFKRGAMKATLLQVPNNVQPTEREKLKSWWQQMFSGIGNAWRTNVVSQDVKHLVIGEGLEHMESAELTRKYREDIAAAFGIPLSKMLSNAANYATAKQDNIAFYEETVFPELALILDAINGQWLSDYGVRLVAHPEQTEAMQDAQAQQAAAITELVGQPILTVNEGRAWIGLEPMDEAGALETSPDEDAEYQAMAADAQADADAEDAAEQPTDAETKALPLPGTATRAAERRAMLGAHATVRQQTRERHHAERLAVRQRGAQTRQQAPDARSRLTAMNRQRIEIATLMNRQSYERQMMRSLHAAERGRLKERHASDRAAERAGAVALELPTKALPPTLSDDAIDALIDSTFADAQSIAGAE